MIVASLLLILVAVTLLVLGLTGGSSSLLISSIVASLLAAVALVIGARQNAAARAAREPEPEPVAPRSDDFAGQAGPFAAEPADSAVFAAEPEFLSDPHDRRETVQFEPASTGFQDPDRDPYEQERDRAYEAGRRDATAGAPGARHGDDLASGDDYAATGDDYAAGGDDLVDEPDYGRAADAINAARSDDPGANSWRRMDAHAEPAAADLAGDSLGEADEDDPADEPLPQVVSPGDAVRVARMEAEVLVVDGRPRYHVSDCQHLLGRISEPIPVNEAVELGFSPCGLCRPVDRLVAAAARP